MPSTFDPRTIDSRLRRELRRLVRRMQARRLHRRSAVAWTVCAGATLALVLLAWIVAAPPQATVAAAGAVFLACGWIVSRWWRVEPRDYAAAAALLEQAHPELRQSLRTALEQRPDADGNYTFLQTCVINEALGHAARHFWSRTPLSGARTSAGWHGVALAATAAAMVVAVHVTPTLARRLVAGAKPAARANALEVVPGDAEVERGTTVVFTARFGRDVPGRATLRWRTADGEIRTQAMAQSLSDPVFAATLPHLARDIDYAVVFDGGESPAYRISVYDLPSMLRGDAALEFPAFTGLEPRVIEDTRRISAVEGTRLDYSVLTNKAVRRALLRGADGAEVALTPANPERTRFAAALTIDASRRYTLHLEDDDGRPNRAPPEIRIEALPNRRPELKFAFPRGDQRVSALEEIAFEASAADDFGLLDFGIAWSLADGEPHYLSRRPAVGEAPGRPPRTAEFSDILALEAHGIAPAQLVTWFAWADDMGSDGQPRRTTSDVFFGEVRPFDEVFREGEGGEQSGGMQGGQEAADLLELQREISLALWKLRDRAPASEGFHDDVSTVLESQREVRMQAENLAVRLTDAQLRAAAVEADRHMGGVVDRLEEAREQSDSGPIAAAWSRSQGALQALLRLQPDESMVNRQRNARGGSQGRGGNQRQLDKLRFKDEDDRYETESEARLSSTPEEREQMQTLARLRELARRQGDLNERLQQLQTALEAAKDEAEREEIKRELRRLEEEQRRMLADLDELRQRMDGQAPGAPGADAREQVERTRDDMLRTRESLEEGAVSRALASGTRARETLEEARESLREQSAGEFADEMRELRREARELAEAQARTEAQIAEDRRTRAPSLDNSSERDEVARAIEENREALRALNEQLRTVTEEAEEAEPGLYRQLYDILREQGQGGGPDDRMQASAELMRRGFVDQARELQPQITESINELARGVERAAGTVLGDEAATLRFAQAELNELVRDLGSGEREREDGRQSTGDDPARPGSPREPGSSPTDEAGSGRGDGSRAEDPGKPADAPGEGGDGELSRALRELAAGRSGGGTRDGGGGGDDFEGPITGADFGTWEERLRTVEALLDQPDARERLARARELAAELRREYRRHGTPPQWATVEGGIVAPLSEVRSWLRQELARLDDPATLQPVDRDPVPEAYAEAVQKYYEALGAP